MYLKFIKRPSRFAYLSLFFMSSFYISTAQATTWSENADAGDLINTAQIPIGSTTPGSLTAITGVISTSHDADLYKIHVDDTSIFAVSVSGGEGPNGWDSTLALFDINGLGVYQNDDRAEGVADSFLPSNHALGPSAPRIYYLAIFDDDSGALSGSTIDDLIFPIAGFPFTDVVGPTGNGGGSPLSQWGFPATEFPIDGHYNIALTGASFVPAVPEPETYAMLLAGLGMLGAIARRRKNHTR